MTSSGRRACVCAAAGLLAWIAGAAPADAQATTALFFDSQPGDYVGQGVRRTGTAAELTFTASLGSDRSSITISARTNDFSTWWDARFAAPAGMPLATGTYENAARYPFQAWVSPGLSVGGSGRGCNEIIGRFVVHEIAAQNDLCWQHQTTGAVAIWYMHETVRVSAELLSPASVADTQWKIRTVVDVDHDGYPDLIWQHGGNGLVAVWFMTGSRLRSGELLSPGEVSDLNWKIVGSGDVDRDGNPDLFWHHALTGQIAVWFMRGRVATSGQAISPDRVADTAWQIRGTADLDGNGSPDLIWQNTTTLQLAAWLMNGLRLIDGRLIAGPMLPSADWHVVSPR